MRTRVYVDGFNLYYGALKGTPFKWLGPVELAHRALPPRHVVDRLKYFTARVSGATDSGAPARQQVYLNALLSRPRNQKALRGTKQFHALVGRLWALLGIGAQGDLEPSSPPSPRRSASGALGDALAPRDGACVL